MDTEHYRDTEVLDERRRHNKKELLLIRYAL